MEKLKQFVNALKNNNEKEIKKFINKSQDGNPLSLVNYLCYIQDIDTLKKIAKYINFNVKTKFCFTLNKMIKANGVDLETVNKDNCIEILNKALKSFKKNIGNMQVISTKQIKLFNAIIADNTDEIEKLLSNNIKLINTKYFDIAPLMITIMFNCQNTCKKLIELGIDVNLKNNEGVTALTLAAYNGHAEIVKELLKYKDINVNLQDNRQGCTALIYAAYNGHIEIVKELLKCTDIQVNLQKDDGWTALMVAVQQGYTEIVKELLKREDIKINLQNNNGFTALMVAVYRGHTEIVKELLKQENIDLGLKNKDNKTAFDIAKIYRYNDITNLIQDEQTLRASKSIIAALLSLKR